MDQFFIMRLFFFYFTPTVMTIHDILYWYVVDIYIYIYIYICIIQKIGIEG